MVPDTSNVLPLDLVWKLGLGGVALIIIVLLFSFTCFRVAGVRREQLAASPALAVVILIVPVCVFNNAMGRPWTWALLAVCLAAWRLSSIEAAGGPASQGELRPTVQSKSVAGGRDSD
jgi:peptidoglycan/LPS O-acetylase OafA/YrhL